MNEFARRLGELRWVEALLVAGSLATGDYVFGVSDLDLVAIASEPLGDPEVEVLAALHGDLDRGVAAHLGLGCAYVASPMIADPTKRHPTWTHGSMVHRRLSGITRVELALHGVSLLGPEPGQFFPPVTADDVRAAARAEIDGYWVYAARRPWMWLSPTIADLGLTGMARGRYAMRTGRLLTKSDAVEQVRAPAWLQDQLRERRRGRPVRSPRVPTAAVAWTDACRTIGIRRLLGRPPSTR